MIYVYTHTKTARLTYVLDVLLITLLKKDYKFVDKAGFLALDTRVPKINYSEEELPYSIWVKPHSLLFEVEIKPQDVAVTHQGNISYLFKTSDTATIPYDIFASSFYMLSRYEEYLTFEPDSHGRFMAKQSLAYKANFIHKPVVTMWANRLEDLLVKQFPTLELSPKAYTQHNTIDVDYAYDIKGKPFFRRMAGTLKALITLDVTTLKTRWRYCLGGKDPFDVYAYLKTMQETNIGKTTYFFQVGDYGVFDKNLPLKNTLKKLIKQVAGYAAIGLHPSYASNASFEKLQKEHWGLTQVLERNIQKSRQHFLKVSFPETFENLIKLGVTEDYSLGFAQSIGFRAGIAQAFPFFNLKTNTQRPLLLYPFQVMDVTLKDYLHLSPKEAIEQIMEMKSLLQREGGEFTSLFHNSSLTDAGEWKGWLAVYEAAVG